MFRVDTALLDRHVPDFAGAVATLDAPQCTDAVTARVRGNVVKVHATRGPMTARSREVRLDDVRADARALLYPVPAGESLDEPTAALIGVAVRAGASALDMDGAVEHAHEAINACTTPDQVHESLVLVAGIGVHTLM